MTQPSHPTLNVRIGVEAQLLIWVEMHWCGDGEIGKRHAISANPGLIGEPGMSVYLLSNPTADKVYVRAYFVLVIPMHSPTNGRWSSSRNNHL